MARLAALRSSWQALDESGFRAGPIERAQLEGTPGDDRLHGRRAPDTIDGLAGDDLLNGRPGDDTLDGGKGADVLRGSRGKDDLYGGAGDDVLYGGTEQQEFGDGRDQLDGGLGDDRLYGGFEADLLTGGSGHDRFTYLQENDSNVEHSDTVLDFEQGFDEIVFRGIFREAGDLHFIGTSSFSGAAGEVRFDSFSDRSVVSVDLDGNGLKDFQIGFIGEIHFEVSDFSF